MHVWHLAGHETSALEHEQCKGIKGGGGNRWANSVSVKLPGNRSLLQGTVWKQTGFLRRTCTVPQNMTNMGFLVSSTHSPVTDFLRRTSNQKHTHACTRKRTHTHTRALQICLNSTKNAELGIHLSRLYRNGREIYDMTLQSDSQFLLLFFQAIRSHGHSDQQTLKLVATYWFNSHLFSLKYNMWTQGHLWYRNRKTGGYQKVGSA